MAGEKRADNATPGGTPTTATEPQQKKGVSRFFSSLLCCAAPKKDDEETLAAKKADNRTRPDRTSLPPGQRQDPVTTADSSNAASTAPLNEKQDLSEAGPSINHVSQPTTTVYNGTTGAPIASGTTTTTTTTTTVATAPAITKIPSREQTPIAPIAMRTEPESSSSQPSISVVPATPTATTLPPPAAENIIHDRTHDQEQLDKEIEAAELVPVSPNDVSATSEDAGPVPVHKDASQVKIDLPPPPPLAERQTQITPPQTPELGSAQQEPQKWLLPPIRQEFKGRKCLVLDLDETLVHSSFKV